MTLPMPGSNCTCCPTYEQPQPLAYVNGAVCCVVCDAALRFPSLARECKALGRLLADMQGEGLEL